MLSALPTPLLDGSMIDKRQSLGVSDSLPASLGRGTCYADMSSPLPGCKREQETFSGAGPDFNELCS